jgi:WD40 repeat protein
MLGTVELSVQTDILWQSTGRVFSPDGRFSRERLSRDDVTNCGRRDGTSCALKGHGTFMYSLLSDFKNSVVFSPDSRTLVTESRHNGQAVDVRLAACDLGTQSHVNAVAISPDGKTASVGDTTIRLWISQPAPSCA